MIIVIMLRYQYGQCEHDDLHQGAFVDAHDHIKGQMQQPNRAHNDKLACRQNEFKSKMIDLNPKAKLAKRPAVLQVTE